ncbi:zf-HC2 domain-containing protein [Paludisphaera mucosa]|uniref:Zf-HC2 domain-containing protein n=1 Tax=Paludisphaera mucosa TaxID=3030827 RepID=A0ABT6FBU7_9BACT|nr:zf-HC2 domain-containing protein [Paludisphaera mucosa]MDG3005056.1 zf-HC2 domain-containing protein [Paludisphaera mucosa]
MNGPRRLLRILTLRCASASELASQQLDGPLPTPERLALAGHLLVCSSCRRFRGQIRFLREACRRRAAGPQADAIGPEALSAEARGRIAQALREAAADDDGA